MPKLNLLEIISKISDTREAVREKKLGLAVVTIVDVYSIDKEFTNSQLRRIASMLIT